MEYCAPGGGSDGSCFSLKSLRKIAIAYNAEHRDKVIKNIGRLTKSQLVREITDRLSHVCPNQWCWIDQNFVKKINDPEIQYLTFRPRRPVGKYRWLSTDDIYKVMSQYQEIYKNFRFFGPVPIDFDIVHQELANLQLGRLYRKGIRKIGIVYNLDPHDKPGSHWVSLYVDLGRKLINFFDSFGSPPPPQIVNFINRISGHYEDFGNSKKKFTVNINTYRHQHANSECGVYSIYFIVQSLKGKSFNEIVSNTVSDEEMNLCRLRYFRPSGQK